jgi:hypothetical protein
VSSDKRDWPNEIVWLADRNERKRFSILRSGCGDVYEENYII